MFLLFQNSSTEVMDSTVQNTSQTKSDVVSRLLGKGIDEINQMYETSNNLKLLRYKCKMYQMYNIPYSLRLLDKGICEMNQMYKTSQSQAVKLRNMQNEPFVQNRLTK